jgi:hypothetical protein
MTRLEFIRAFKAQTSDAAIFGTLANLESPPGREPREQDVKLSHWYCGLSDEGRAAVRDTIREAAELAAFSVLCILDGVSVVEDGSEVGKLDLVYTKNNQTVTLNGSAEELLHDSYNKLCRSSKPQAPSPAPGRAYEVGQVKVLRDKLTVEAGLDIHVIPQGSEVAIALPKNEHRKF